MVFYTHYYRMEEKPLKALAQLRGLSGEGTVEEVIASLHGQDEETEQRKQREREAKAAEALTATDKKGDVDNPDSEWSVVGKNKKKAEKNVVNDAGKPEAESKTEDDGRSTETDASEPVANGPTAHVQLSQTLEDQPITVPNTAPESRVTPPAVHEQDAQADDKPKKKKKNRRGGRNKKKAKQAAQATPDTASARETAKEEGTGAVQLGVSKIDLQADSVAGKPSKAPVGKPASLARAVEDIDESIVDVEDADEQGPVVVVDTVLSVATPVHDSSTGPTQVDAQEDVSRAVTSVADSDATQRPPTARSVPDTQLTEAEIVSAPLAVQTDNTKALLLAGVTETELSPTVLDEVPNGREDLLAPASLDTSNDEHTSCYRSLPDASSPPSPDEIFQHKTWVDASRSPSPDEIVTFQRKTWVDASSPPSPDEILQHKTWVDASSASSPDGIVDAQRDMLVEDVETDTMAEEEDADKPLPKKKAKKRGKKGGKRVNKHAKAEPGSGSQKSTLCFAIGAVLGGMLGVGLSAWAML